MPFPDLDDPFTLWRFLLFLTVTLYTLIVLGQTAWSYFVWLSPADRYTSILRRYLVVHSLRVRLRTFGGDLAVCALLVATLALLGWLHLLASQGHL